MKPPTFGELTAKLVHVQETNLFYSVARPYFSFRRAEFIAAPRCVTVPAIIWKPGASILTPTPDGRWAFNTWRPRYIQGPASNPAPFIEFINRVFGPEAEDFLDWLAHIEQYPGELPPYHWAIVGSDNDDCRLWLINCLSRVWPSFVSIENRRGEALAQKYLTITHAWGIRRNTKFPPFNALRWLIFSNHVKLIPDDFRICRHKSNNDVPYKLSEGKPSFELLKNKSFINGVALFLAKRNISNFKFQERKLCLN